MSTGETGRGPPDGGSDGPRGGSGPYGEVRGTKPTAWPNKRSYLGTGIDDVASGLTHIGAREYDQNTGRFLSTDPVIDVADPLQINGYAYSRNSPISTSDPDGLRPRGVCENAGGCAPGTKEWFTQDDEGRWTQHMSQTTTTSREDGSTLFTYTHTSGGSKTKSYVTVGDYGRYNGIAPPMARDNPLYGPQPKRTGLWGFIRDIFQGPVCNPGYKCEDLKFGVVPQPGGGLVPMPGPRKIPMGFANGPQFQAFRLELNEGLRRAGYKDVTPIMQGSSVTGRSFKSGRPFGPHSDYDVASASRDLLERAKEAGIPLRSQGTRTGPLASSDLAALGLRDLSRSLKASAARDVHFMIYGTVESALGGAPSIVLRP